MTPHNALSYCPDLLSHTRRMTREVMVGNVGVGGNNPIRVQSMITSDTRDTPACVAEVLALAEAGCEIVRITAQTKVYAANLENIAREVRAAGCHVPLVADIHFKPDAAMEAAKWVEKIRVNPGNYVDKKKFEIREYSDDQYEAELEKIRDQFIPLVHLCKDLGRAMRIGTNHGSLSDRIMNRYGDTPLGMCESALEFARIARENDYHNFVFSMKASNPKVMIEAYRLLVARLDAEGADWNYPIHLGVTEAGDGEDGRIKSAIGIGSLLADGIGDTVRVSLTEDAVYEIPVAQAIVELHSSKKSGSGVPPQSVWEASCLPSITSHAEKIQPDWTLLERKDSSFLPHWRIPGATYSVTFRLKDSIPKDASEKYQQRKEILSAKLKHHESTSTSRNKMEELLEIRSEINSLYFECIDTAENATFGTCQLKDSRIASLVENAIKHFDGKRYDLHAWSVMPNHVHALIKPLGEESLEKIIHSWKSFCAKEANKILGQEGGFWQEEYYDHIVRNDQDFRHQVKYILNNPFMAGTAEDWTGSCYNDGAGCPINGLEQDAPATASASGSGVSPQSVREASCLPSLAPSYDPFSYERRSSSVLTIQGHVLGGDKPVRVFTTQERWNALAHKIANMGDFKPEIISEKSGILEIDPRDDAAFSTLNGETEARLITVADGITLAPIHAFRMLAFKADPRHPILLKDTLDPPTGETDFLKALLPAAQNLGSLLCDGIGDAILVRGESAPGASLRLAYNILQAAGTRIFKTDYVACPSCGRTLFNLQSTTQKIRAATGHLKGVRIAVMGCIVNGPGEMADADFGYVGGAPGKINLYVGKTAVKFNIPESDAVERLIDLIKEHDKWIEAPLQAPASV
jgi:1-hydroxy-2-methyl-2-(E)-butenyl 4-diphosphate synthase